MGVKQASVRGGVQTVTHVNQLRLSRGYKALLVLSDYTDAEESVELTYVPTLGRWVSSIRPAWKTSDFFVGSVNGYLNSTFQGTDSQEVNGVFLDGQEYTFGISEDDLGRGWLQGYRYPEPGDWEGQYLQPMLPINIIPYLKAGLVLQARAFFNDLDEDGVGSENVYFGPGVYTSKRFTVFDGISDYDTYTLEWGESESLHNSAIRGNPELLSPSPIPQGYEGGIFQGSWRDMDFFNTPSPRVFRLTDQTDVGISNYPLVNAFIPHLVPGQPLFLAVFSTRDDGTSPANPTVINGTATWVEVANVLFDSSGSLRGRLTLFRTESEPFSGDYPFLEDGEVDWGGVNQGTIAIQVFTVIGADDGGTNGSAAVVQSATASAGADTPVSATLAAFGSSDNITFFVHAKTREADYPSQFGDVTEIDDWQANSMNTVGFFGNYGFGTKYGVDTSPTEQTSLADASGIIAIELKLKPGSIEPDCGEYSVIGVGGYKEALSGDIDITIRRYGCEYRFATP